jgi:DNA damage-binding protein 1
LLFILTAKYNAMILEATGEGDNLEIETKAHGNVADRNRIRPESVILAIVDPGARVIGLRLYEGLLKIFPLTKDCTELKGTSIRFVSVL